MRLSITSFASAAVTLLVSVGVSFATASNAVAQVVPNNTITTTEDNRDNRRNENGNGIECPAGSEAVQAANQAAYDALVSKAQTEGTFVQKGGSRATGYGFCKLTNTLTNEQQQTAQAKAEQLIKDSGNAKIGDIAPKLQAALKSENNISLTPSQATEIVTAVQNKLSQNVQSSNANNSNAAAANTIEAGNSADHYTSTATTTVEANNGLTRVTDQNGSVTGASCESEFETVVKITLSDGTTRNVAIRARQKVTVAALQKGLQFGGYLQRNGFQLSITNIETISTGGECLNANEVAANFKQARDGSITALQAFSGATATAKAEVDIRIKIDGNGNYTSYR